MVNNLHLQTFWVAYWLLQTDNKVLLQIWKYIVIEYIVIEVFAVCKGAQNEPKWEKTSFKQ